MATYQCKLRLEKWHENRDSRYVKLTGQKRCKYIAALELRVGWRYMRLTNYDADADGICTFGIWAGGYGWELGTPVFGGDYLTIVAYKAVADDEMEFLCVVTHVGIDS